MTTYRAGLQTQVRVGSVGGTAAKVGIGLGGLLLVPLVLIGGLALASLGGGK